MLINYTQKHTKNYNIIKNAIKSDARLSVIMLNAKNNVYVKNSFYKC